MLQKIFLLWPLVFVPVTLYVVTTFGNSAGNVLLGALFFYLLVRKADLRTRKLMVTLAIVSMLFETANVAAGIYKYAGTLGSPAWISFGWAILGWWVSSLRPELERIEFRHAFASVAIALVAVQLATSSFSLVSSVIAIAGLYALSLASRQPFATFAFVSFFAFVAEHFGPASGAWTYFDLSGSGAAIAPDLASLALAYSSVFAFCSWVSGFEK